MIQDFQSNTIREAVQLHTELDFESIAKSVQMVVSTAMLIECFYYMLADSYARAAGRSFQANGFKLETFTSCLGVEGWRN